jgi:hypothetical protein
MSDDNNKSEIIDIEPEDIIDQKAEEPTSNAPENSGTSRKIFGVGAIAVMLAGIAGGWVYRDLLANYFPNDQVQAMSARVDMLETNTKSMSSKLDAVVGVTDEIKSQLGAAQAAAEDADNIALGLKSESNATTTSIVALQSALAKANSALDELRTKISSGTGSTTQGDNLALGARVENLEKDVASLRQLGSTGTNDNAALSQSLADLKAKIAAGVSFQGEYGRVQRLVPAAEGLEELGKNAALGLPNAKGLAAELKAIANVLPDTQVAAAASQDESWWGTATSLIASLVTVKTAGTSDWHLLAEQSASLAELGELSKAVSTLEQGEGALPVELQKWHDRAAARLQLEVAVEITAAAVLRQIAAKG